VVKLHQKSESGTGQILCPGEPNLVSGRKSLSVHP